MPSETERALAAYDSAKTPTQRALEAYESNSAGPVESLVTGAGRTEFSDMPEFDVPVSMALTDPLSTARAALGLMTTFDPQREREILAESFPELEFSEDRYGNVIVDAKAYGGGRGYLNKPGASLRDALDVAFQSAAFTPAGRAAKGATFLGRATKTGTAAAGTQVGLDVANQALGGTGEVSLANIDMANVAAAGAGGVVFEGLATLLRKFGPQIARTGGRITDDIRAQFKSAAEQVGTDPKVVTDDVIRSWVAASRNAPSARRMAPEAAAQTEEFGIPFTRGQALPEGRARIRQIEREDTLRESAVSPKAADTMQRFGRTQEQAIEGAQQRIQAGLGGQPINRPNQAAAAVREGVQGRAAVADEAIGEAYEQVGDATLSLEGLKELTRRFATAPRRHEFVLDPDMATAKVLKGTRKLNRTLTRAGDRIKPIPIGKIEAQRRMINRRIDTAINPTDRRQMSILKREFDAYLDEAMDNALFSGDPQALAALKEARGLKAEYMRQFARRDARTKTGRNVKDTAGDYMERMVDANPTDEEIANWLFGATKIGSRRGSAEFAQRLRSVLGTGSEEWQQVRQAAFLKLTEPTREGAISGRILAKRLEEATRGSGESFMRVLFSPDEIATMRRFAKAVRRAQPDIRNPSRTAYKAANMVSEMGGQMLRMLGWSQGGAIGGAAAEAGVRGFGGVKGLRQVAQARNAVGGVARPLSPSDTGAVIRGAGAAGSVGTAQGLPGP